MREELFNENSDIYFKLCCPPGEHCPAHFSLKFLCRFARFGAPLDTKVPCLVHVLGQLIPRFSKVVYLSTSGDKVRSKGGDSTEWSPFFHLFPAIEFLDLSGGVAVHIASALVYAAKMVTGVFPVHHSIGLDKGKGEDQEGHNKDSIEQFLFFVPALWRSHPHSHASRLPRS